MKATLIRHSRLRFADGGMVEVKLWKVPQSAYMPHGYKYSLVYIEGRKRVIGYDNGERRGDHRHYADKEEPYIFISIDQLIRDFRRDVSKWRGKR